MSDKLTTRDHVDIAYWEADAAAADAHTALNVAIENQASAGGAAISPYASEMVSDAMSSVRRINQALRRLRKHFVGQATHAVDDAMAGGYKGPAALMWLADDLEAFCDQNGMQD